MGEIWIFRFVIAISKKIYYAFFFINFQQLGNNKISFCDLVFKFAGCRIIQDINVPSRRVQKTR